MKRATPIARRILGSRLSDAVSENASAGWSSAYVKRLGSDMVRCDIQT
jgi:hypothetical protein